MLSTDQNRLAFLEAIVEGSDDAIATKTLEGVVTSWNPGAERLFGYSASEIVGRPITVLFPPDRLDEETDFLRQLSRSARRPLRDRESTQGRPAHRHLGHALAAARQSGEHLRRFQDRP